MGTTAESLGVCMLKAEFLKSIFKFLHPPTPTKLVGLPPYTAITNTFRLPNMEDMQLYVVWNADANDFTESLIFRIVDEHTKEYICSLRRIATESVTDLVKRTVEMAIQKKDSKVPTSPPVNRAGTHLKALMRRFM